MNEDVTNVIETIAPRAAAVKEELSTLMPPDVAQKIVNLMLEMYSTVGLEKTNKYMVSLYRPVSGVCPI